MLTSMALKRIREISRLQLILIDHNHILMTSLSVTDARQLTELFDLMK